jgi:hypothetical protein
MLRLSDVVDSLEQTTNWLRAPAYELGAPPARAGHTRRDLLQPAEALVELLKGLVAFLGYRATATLPWVGSINIVRTSSVQVLLT